MPKKIKKIISIIGVGGGVNPMMENSIMFLLFFFEPFPYILIIYLNEDR